jgi:hypothetical protein
MKRLLFAAAMAAFASPVLADVGVSISVGQPGFYGEINIGGFPRPELIYPRPIVVQPPRVGVVGAPIYLRVPPGYAKHWRKHCHEYHACGRPVYFVQDEWYDKVYAPRYRERYEHGGRQHRGDYDRRYHDDRHDRGYDRGHRHDND